MFSSSGIYINLNIIQHKIVINLLTIDLLYLNNIQLLALYRQLRRPYFFSDNWASSTTEPGVTAQMYQICTTEMLFDFTQRSLYEVLQVRYELLIESVQNLGLR